MSDDEKPEMSEEKARAVLREYPDADLSAFNVKGDVEAIAVAETESTLAKLGVHDVKLDRREWQRTPTRRVIPLGDKVLLRVLPRPEKSAGGIIISAERKGREERAVVERIGILAYGCSPGDIVRFNPYAILLALDVDGMDCTRNAHGKPYSLCIVREESILGIEERESIDFGHPCIVEIGEHEGMRGAHDGYVACHFPCHDLPVSVALCSEDVERYGRRNVVVPASHVRKLWPESDTSSDGTTPWAL